MDKQTITKNVIEDVSAKASCRRSVNKLSFRNIDTMFWGLNINTQYVEICKAIALPVYIKISFTFLLHLLHGNLKAFIFCSLKINLNSSVISSHSVECYMNKKHFSSKTPLVCWWRLKIQTLNTWHYSNFNQHVLLSTTNHCKIKDTLWTHVACEWYVSQSHSAFTLCVFNS